MAHSHPSSSSPPSLLSFRVQTPLFLPPPSLFIPPPFIFSLHSTDPGPPNPSLMIMARLILLPLILTSLLFVSLMWPAAGTGRMVGGRTEIEDVKTNEEIQRLGRFSVEQYNRREVVDDVVQSKEYGHLTFSEVVAAQRQVVSGLKYYLKIAATQNGATNTFDAVVVVKPWLSSKQLLHFAPSASVY